jgi:hypothetical protein
MDIHLTAVGFDCVGTGHREEIEYSKVERLTTSI